MSDIDSPPPEPYCFIQYKGTDICLDLNCECGTLSHLDAMFAYFIKCKNCGAIYKMPPYLTPRKVDEPDPTMPAPIETVIHE